MLQLDLGVNDSSDMEEVVYVGRAMDVNEVVYVGGGVYPNGGAGGVCDDGYGPVAVRTGDWSALWQAAPHVESVASWIHLSQVENCDSSTPQ